MTVMDREQAIATEFGFDVDPSTYATMTELDKLIYRTITKLAGERARLVELAERVERNAATVRKNLTVLADGRGGYKPNSLGELQSSATIFDAACGVVATLHEQLEAMMRLRYAAATA